MKCKDGSSHFYKNQKYRRLGKEKKCIFLLFHFSNFLYGLFQKMLNVQPYFLVFNKVPNIVSHDFETSKGLIFDYALLYATNY